MEEERLRFLALGPVQGRVAGGELPLGSPKQRAVLGLLLHSAPRPVPLVRLVDEVWGSAGGRDPVRSLQVYVSALRRLLAPYGVTLRGGAAGYYLDPGEAGLDVREFEQAAAQARAAAERGDPEGTVAAARRGLSLWRGEAWQDLRAVAALAADAHRLEQLRLETRVRLARARLTLGEHRALLPDLEQLADEHPLDEDLLEMLVLALHRCGRQADALAAYAAGRARKVAETGLEPSQRLRDLQARVLADDPLLAVEEAELRTRRHLPAQVTGIVGREEQVAGLVALVASAEGRVVTVTGPGGVGKTRVAVEVAHRSAARFSEGVWFVGLADVADAALVPQAVAEVLGVDADGGDFAGPLRRRCASGERLLVLDNFEHVTDAATLVSDLLATGAGTHVLVTSRTPLRVYGEQVRELPTLAVRDAVPLFVERARRVAPGFAGPHEDVARLCEALDGLPLALELVAARADEVPLPRMLEQLDSRLDLADHGPRDRSARQRSLRRAVAWSTDLLPPAEAAAFARLGVFVGGFEPEAAAEVAGVEAEVLASLRRASLLGVDDGRYRMLETVREHALELAGDASGSVRDALAEWCCRVAEDAVEGMRSPEATTWLRRLQAERANMREAMAHLAVRAVDDPAAAATLLRTAAALGMFWYRTSPGTEDVAWLERGLALAGGADPLLRARAHYALATCRGEQGHAEQALEHGRAAYRLLDEVDAPEWAARALNTLAGVTRDLGRPEEAVGMMEEAVALRRRLADPALPLTVALANRAIVALDLDDLATARACLEECATLAAEDPGELALVHATMADLALAEGDPDHAASLLRSSVTVLRTHQRRYRLAESLETFAALAVQWGRPRDAAVLLAAADRMLEEEGAALVPADAAMRARRTGPAVTALPVPDREQATALGRSLTLDQALDWALARL